MYDVHLMGCHSKIASLYEMSMVFVLYTAYLRRGSVVKYFYGGCITQQLTEKIPLCGTKDTMENHCDFGRVRFDFCVWDVCL